MKSVRVFNFFLSCLVLSILSISVSFFFGFHAFKAPGSYAEEKTFIIKPNTGALAIAYELENLGLINNAWIFRIGASLTGNDQELKAGKYKVPPNASMRDIMMILKDGKSIMQSLTIPEGMTVEQAMERIAETPDLSGDMPDKFPDEGMILADTQHFMYGTTRHQIIQKMLRDQKLLIEKIWAKRSSDLPIKNINEFVILASIVEKETSLREERSRVASVFINRLKKGMRLQSDPTIIYGLFGGKGNPSNRPIFQDDIEKRTPYNTYSIKGLPPTPIANPGRESLEAVANPIKTDDLYFVADGQGGHIFSKTLKEHNKHVSRWNKIKKMLSKEDSETYTSDRKR